MCSDPESRQDRHTGYVRTEWTVRDDVRTKLRSSFKRLLVEYKYPPDKQPEAIRSDAGCDFCVTVAACQSARFVCARLLTSSLPPWVTLAVSSSGSAHMYTYSPTRRPNRRT